MAWARAGVGVTPSSRVEQITVVAAAALVCVCVRAAMSVRPRKPATAEPVAAVAAVAAAPPVHTRQLPSLGVSVGESGKHAWLHASHQNCSGIDVVRTKIASVGLAIKGQGSDRGDRYNVVLEDGSQVELFGHSILSEEAKSSLLTANSNVYVMKKIEGKECYNARQAVVVSSTDLQCTVRYHTEARTD